MVSASHFSLPEFHVGLQHCWQCDYQILVLVVVVLLAVALCWCCWYCRRHLPVARTAQGYQPFRLDCCSRVDVGGDFAEPTSVDQIFGLFGALPEREAKLFLKKCLSEYPVFAMELITESLEGRDSSPTGKFRRTGMRRKTFSGSAVRDGHVDFAMPEEVFASEPPLRPRNYSHSTTSTLQPIWERPPSATGAATESPASATQNASSSGSTTGEADGAELGNQFSLVSHYRVMTRNARKGPLSPDTPSASPGSRQLQRGVTTRHLQETPTVEFLYTQVYCSKTSDSSVVLAVGRVGNVERRSEVRFVTQSSTAIHGRHFIGHDSVLVFEPGTTRVDLEVELLSGGPWTSTLEFHVELITDDIQMAQLPANNWRRCSVKIVDYGTFPTEKYAAEINAEEIEEKVSWWKLLLEYGKLVWQNDRIRKGTIKRALVENCHNVSFLGGALIYVHLVDRILNPMYPPFDDQSCLQGLLILVVLKMTLHGGCHWLDYAKLAFGTGGESRMFLQTALLRKFLSYTHAAQERVTDGDLLMIMQRDILAIVSNGWYGCIALVAEIGRVLSCFAYIGLMGVLYHKKAGLLTIPVCAIPVFMAIVMYVRSGFVFRSSKNKISRHNVVAETLDQAIRCDILLRNYNHREKFVSRFAYHVNQFHQANRINNQLRMNNTYLGGWVSELCQAAYYIVAGYKVIIGELQLGIFLADVRMLVQLGACWVNLFDIMISLESVMPALTRLVYLMNLPTVHSSHHEAYRKHRHTSHRPCIDEQEIVMHDVTVDIGELRIGQVKGCFGPWSMTIKQSQLVALIGKPGHGRNVALRLLSQDVVPISSKAGRVSIPTHLRTLYVSSAPLFMDGTLMYNLTFALSHGAESSRVQTVRTLCEILNFTEEFLDEYLPHSGVVMRKLSTLSHHAGEDMEDAPRMNWGTVLSRSQQQRLSLVRAIMFDPRLLCLEGPFDSLGEDAMDTVGDMLSHFVHEGGSAGIVGGHCAVRSRDRAPRTCVATLRTGQPVDLFDCAYLVTKTRIKDVDLADPQKVALSLIRGYTGQLDEAASQEGPSPHAGTSPRNSRPWMA